MTINYPLLIIVILLSIIGSTYYIRAQIDISEYNKVEVGYIYTCDLLCQAKMKINQIGDEPYVLFKNDCTHHSYNLTRELKSLGINATCMLGLYDSSSSHMWVRAIIDNETLYIEATDGIIIDNDTYKNEYKHARETACMRN